MASSKERWLSHISLKLAIKSYPDSGLSLQSAFKALKDHPSFGKTDFALADARWVTQLVAVDLTTHKGFAILLFLNIDKDRAATVYGNVNTLSLTTTFKGLDDGVAATAHLVVRLPTLSGTNHHYAILEDIEGLSRTRVVYYIQFLLENFVDFPGVDDKGNAKNLKSTLHDDVVLDRPISDQLKDARLIAVDVFRRAKSSTIDKKAPYFERTRSIEYKPTSKPTGQRAKNIISEVLGLTDKVAYPEVRIRLQEPRGKERTVAVDRGKQDALASAFQLRTLIPAISPPLEEASKTFVPHLIEAMLKHFPPK